MATNPLVPQGTLNRIKGSVLVTNAPELNVTAPFLGREGISISFEGQTTAMLGTMTGVVTSPEAYQMATVTLALLKTQALANAYEQRRKTNARIGNIVVHSDTTLDVYEITNCAIENIAPLKFNGEDAGYTVTVQGAYLVNSDMFNLA